MRFTRHNEEMRACKRLRTTTHQNPLFNQLNYDIRHIIYNHITLPPFAGAKSWQGLYLSCHQIKSEMDQAASVRLRTYLLSSQQTFAKDSDGLVRIELTKEVASRPVPRDTIMNIRVTMNTESQALDLSYWIGKLRDMLLGLKIGRLHVHIKLPPKGYYLDGINGSMAMTKKVIKLDQLLHPPHNQNSGIRIQETMMTWKAAEEDEAKTDKTLVLQGQKFETAEMSASGSYCYWFRHEAIDCGAWVITTPSPFYSTVVCSKVTLDFTTLEISDGEKGTLKDAVVEQERFYESYRSHHGFE